MLIIRINVLLVVLGIFFISMKIPVEVTALMVLSKILQRINAISVLIIAKLANLQRPHVHLVSLHQLSLYSIKRIVFNHVQKISVFRLITFNAETVIRVVKHVLADKIIVLHVFLI